MGLIVLAINGTFFFALDLAKTSLAEICEQQNYNPSYVRLHKATSILHTMALIGSILAAILLIATVAAPQNR